MKITATVRRKINRALNAAGFDGNLLFESRAAAYRKVCEILQGYGILVTSVADSDRHLVFEPQPSEGGASFSVYDTTSGEYVLLLSLQDSPDGVEAVAYVS